MPEPTLWPPPPDRPDPLTANDAFLAGLILAPATRPPVSRLRLIWALRQATGRDLRECEVTVNHYCERHGIFPLPRGVRKWLVVMNVLGPLALAAVLIVSEVVLRWLSASAPTLAARHVLLQQQLAITEVCLILIPVSLVATIVTHRRAVSEAKEARRKLGGGLEP